jgi:acyl-coenzyme A synthetase/AMP-(fatty) acid ligase
MYLDIIGDNGKVTRHRIDRGMLNCEILQECVGFINSQSKEANALDICSVYFSSGKAVLYDETNTLLQAQIETLNIDKIGGSKERKTIFDDEDFLFIYYTSGSTGMPVAALKTKENILSEIEVITALLEKYHIKKVIVTVPFIHLYGTLFGLIYPLVNNIDVIIKEHFLPFDLLDMIDEYTMVVTTPLYIKALNKLSGTKNLDRSLFISSTAPLDTDSIILFNQKYKADIMQVFGSTETGGIAYKMSNTECWTPFKTVSIDVNEKNELIVRSPFVSKRLFEDNFFIDTHGAIETFDYIEKDENNFKLIGRSSKIFKLAGKRYSTIQIEQILESQKSIDKALVYVEMEEEALRGEYLDITIESQKHYAVSEIRKILRDKLSNLKFGIKLNIVEKIPVNKIGKKLRIT